MCGINESQEDIFRGEGDRNLTTDFWPEQMDRIHKLIRNMANVAAVVKGLYLGFPKLVTNMKEQLLLRTNGI